MLSFTRVIAIVSILVLGVLCREIVSNSIENQVLKTDFAEINHIKYGLFSVDEWKKQLQVVVSDEIGNFDLSGSTEKKLKAQVQVQLGVLIDKVEAKIRKKNEGSFKGRIKQAFINAVVDIKDIKAGIPEYADAIMLELKKAKNERQLKSAVKKQVAKYFDKTFDVQDKTDLDNALLRAGTTDVQRAKILLDERIDRMQALIAEQSWMMIAIALMLFVMIGSRREKLSVGEYVSLLCALIALLVVGVSTPMIDMEAKIGSMSFVLLDHDIVFRDQILYFQSKSILDVFWIMITNPEFQMRIVGLLVVTFSVVFPLTKMVSMCLYHFDFKDSKKNRLVRFFVLKSGKWSMSDVLVVAIFMAYVGFNGIITSQMKELTNLAEGVELITTNGTTLQPGFYLFLTYVLLGLFLSAMLSRKERQSPIVVEQERPKEGRSFTKLLTSRVSVT
jgi:hypothetical protein